MSPNHAIIRLRWGNVYFFGVSNMLYSDTTNHHFDTTFSKKWIFHVFLYHQIHHQRTTIVGISYESDNVCTNSSTHCAHPEIVTTSYWCNSLKRCSSILGAYTLIFLGQIIEIEGLVSNVISPRAYIHIIFGWLIDSSFFIQSHTMYFMLFLSI